MFGYATDETPELMPLPIALAHRLARRLAAVRKDGSVPYLRPDGKTQVTVVYEDDQPVAVDTVVVSSQHAEDISIEQLLTPDIKELVVEPELAALGLPTDGYRLLVNPTGKFVIGGPMGDAGLTGRKIIVDTYGGMARHGGGAFSGKDPSKVDRSGAYAMRWVAKNVVAAGLARRCEVQVAYAIGAAHPSACSSRPSAPAPSPRTCWRRRSARSSTCARARSSATSTCCGRSTRPTAAYGHFGRTDVDLPVGAAGPGGGPPLGNRALNDDRTRSPLAPAGRRLGPVGGPGRRRRPAGAPGPAVRLRRAGQVRRDGAGRLPGARALPRAAGRRDRRGSWRTPPTSPARSSRSRTSRPASRCSPRRWPGWPAVGRRPLRRHAQRRPAAGLAAAAGQRREAPDADPRRAAHGHRSGGASRGIRPARPC